MQKEPWTCLKFHKILSCLYFLIKENIILQNVIPMEAKKLDSHVTNSSTIELASLSDDDAISESETDHTAKELFIKEAENETWYEGLQHNEKLQSEEKITIELTAAVDGIWLQSSKGSHTIFYEIKLRGL